MYRKSSHLSHCNHTVQNTNYNFDSRQSKNDFLHQFCAGFKPRNGGRYEQGDIQAEQNQSTKSKIKTNEHQSKQRKQCYFPWMYSKLSSLRVSITLKIIILNIRFTKAGDSSTFTIQMENFSMNSSCNNQTHSLKPCQFVLGSGMGNIPAAAAPRGGENPRNFCRFVRMLIEHRKYKNAMEQSVGSSPCSPLWLIFFTSAIGWNGSLAITFPSKRELRSPKTMNRTNATTAPDLNLKSERSRLDSLSEVSTRLIFLDLDFFVTILAAVSVFIVSSFLEALSIEDLRDL
ncbi:hypothetical protein LINPERPRIM_LOCUS26954 [Linum perenne]